MSKLEDYLSNELFTRFGHYSIRRNYYPDWLKESSAAVRLQLDFFIPEINVAVEVQGEQHFRFVEYFHKDLAGFAASQKRDQDKAYLCKMNGVKLYEIFNYLDADLFVAELIEKEKSKGIIVKEKHRMSKEELEKIEGCLKTIRRIIPAALVSIEERNYESLEFYYSQIKTNSRYILKNSQSGIVSDRYISEIIDIEKRCADVFEERRKDPEAMKDVRARNKRGNRGNAKRAARRLFYDEARKIIRKTDVLQ